MGAGTWGGEAARVALWTALAACAAGCTSVAPRSKGPAVVQSLDATSDVVLVGGPSSPCAPPAVATAAPCPCPPAPCRPACGLPCETGASWHLRAVGGYGFGIGDDPPGDCGYFGVDAGRTFCGCLGVDGFYRLHEGRFDRAPGGEDGGRIHHVGVKATYETSLGNSRLYAWGGAGPEYFWTEDYLVDDSGFGAYAEAGLGYVLHRNWRVRAGVNVHGIYSDVTRADPADDGDSRWFFVVAPVIQLELDF